MRSSGRVLGAVVVLVLLLAGLGLAADRYDLPTRALQRFVWTPTALPPTPTATATPAPWAPVLVSLVTEDGLTLAATYFPPMEQAVRVPGLVLLHEAFGVRQSWQPFALAAQQAGFAVLVPDFRGHGASLGEQVFDGALDYDFEATLAWIQKRPEVDAQRVAVAGASLGASIALRGAARHPEIRAVAMLSPGTLLWQVDARPAITDYGQRPLLLAVAEEDAYPLASCRQLGEQALGSVRLLTYPGSAHGTALLRDEAELFEELLAWLAEGVAVE